MEHCAISQRVVSKLSFWRRETQLTATSTSDFSTSPLSPLSPLSVSITAVGVIGYGWTWQIPTTPTTRWLSFSNKASSLSFIPKDANPLWVALLRPVEFWPTLKKAFYNGGWEATSIPTKAENQEGPANSRSNDLQHNQGAIGSLHLRWLLGGLLLGIEPRPIRH